MEFDRLSLQVNGGIFMVAALVVWLAGTRLTHYADEIAERSGLGQALIGALLLGGITSLPEVATVSTAAVGGNAALAVNNVLGGVSMQLAVLALADAFVGKGGLSTLAGASSLLVQGNGLMLVLALAAAGMVSGSMVILGVDLWTTALVVGVLLTLASIRRYEEEPYWRPTERHEEIHPEAAVEATEEGGMAADHSSKRLTFSTVLTGVAVVAGGYFLTKSGDALSVQTGIGASFMGAIFLALATSLPEVSTTLTAVRLGRHRMAFSNIFGTNLFDVGLLFVADVFYRQGAVLGEVGDSALFAALLGILLTAVFVAGILHRGKYVVLRMGIDSALVLLLYAGGAVMLYLLR